MVSAYVQIQNVIYNELVAEKVMNIDWEIGE